MCKCTPEIKTPFCGRGDCQWPKESEKYLIYWKPNERPEGALEYDVIEVTGIEQAFFESVRLKKYGTDIRVYKRIMLKLELVT